MLYDHCSNNLMSSTAWHKAEVEMLSLLGLAPGPPLATEPMDAAGHTQRADSCHTGWWLFLLCSMCLLVKIQV